MAALGALFCIASGLAIVALGWPRRARLAGDVLLRISLAIGFGAGISSVVFFVDLVFGIGKLWLVDTVVFAALLVVWVKRKRFGSPAVTQGWSGRSSDASVAFARSSRQWPIWFQRTLTAAFVMSLVIAIYAAVVRVLAFPHGDGWDAFAIWNLHARFLFLGGAHWRDGFTSLAGGSHPDYPLLLPAAVAHFWALIGQDDPRVPAVMGLAFTFATAGVLFAGVSIVRGRLHAMMAAIALLSTPFFIEQGAAEYADVPLSFFFLASVAILCLFDLERDGRGLLLLAGFASAFGAWTKNEGLLFAFSLVVARLVVHMPSSEALGTEQPGRKDATARFWADPAPLLAVLLPSLALVAYYKHYIGVPGDLFSDPSIALAKLADPIRYWAVLAGYAKGVLRFGRWLWVPGTLVLLALAVAGGADVRFTRGRGFRTSVLALMLTLAGYFGVFLITPYDIHWHLRFSLVRLFLQLWPSVVFLFFLGMRSRSERSGV
jgi:hypothetical protein